MLKEQGHQAPDSPWFTPRVLNRLPERGGSLQRVWWGICAVAMVMCGVCWWWYIDSHDALVVTVRDVLELVAMAAVSLVLLWQAIAVTLQRE